MMDDFYIKGFRMLAEDAKYNLKEVEKIMAKEQKRFLNSIKNYSKEELTALSTHLLLERDSYKTEANMRKIMFDEQRAFSNKIKSILKKKNVTAQQRIKELKKESEYYQNILGQRKQEKQKQKQALNDGRKKGNFNRSTKSRELDQKLEKAIQDYLNFHTEHKITNKELENFLFNDFVRKGAYKASTFTRAVAKIAAKIRKECSGL
jgi:hypothetical protein